MILQEKIKQKAEGYGKLAPVFLEGKIKLWKQMLLIDFQYLILMRIYYEKENK